MSSEYLMLPKNKKTFQDIFFEHLTRILEITRYEFTGGYTKQVSVGNSLINEYVSDKKEEYCQVVEALRDLTHAYFDGKMKTQHKEYLTKIKDAFEKHYNKETLMENSREDYQIYSRKRLKLTQELFRYLCDFAMRKNNFQGKAYIESDENFDDAEPETETEEE